MATQTNLGSEGAAQRGRPQSVVISGATDGIGRHVLTRVARDQHRVNVLARNPEKAERVCREVRAMTGNPSVNWTLCDLSSLASVRRAASSVGDSAHGVDVLINNAAVFELGYGETRDGLERHLGVNFVAPFLLTHLLLPRLRAARAPRIVNVSGETARFACVKLGDLSRKGSFGWSAHWGTFSAYGQSKLALILWTRLWAERFHGSGLCINAIHPGMVGTSHLAGGPRWLDRAWRSLGGTPERAASHIARLAVDQRLAGVSGRYYAGAWRFPPPLLGRSRKTARMLYQSACELSGLSDAERSFGSSPVA